MHYIYALTLMFVVSHGAHVVLLPVHVKSHIAYLLAVGEVLIDRGNRVSLLVGENYPVPEQALQHGIRVITFHTPGVDVNEREKQRCKEIVDNSLNPPSDQLSVVVKLAKYATEQCEFIMKDDKIKVQINDADYFLIDGVPIAPCLAMLPVAMGIPFGQLATQYDPLQTSTPVLPSFNPTSLLPQTDQLTFSQRFTNLMFALFYTLKWNLKDQDALFHKFLPNKARELGSIKHIKLQTNLFLYNQDPIMDYPRLAWPNMVFVGGLTAHEPNALPASINQFLNEASDGLVVVSFGTIATSLPKKINKKLLETFQKLKMQVIVQDTGLELKDVPNNVMIQPWIPQNDILAHKNTQVFVTHCGNNGLYEGLYHAVPMVGLPIFADQPYQALKLRRKGFGISLSFPDFTPDELRAAILEVAHNPYYRDNIKRASQAFRNQSHPRDRAAWWVEHVVAHGNHFRRPVLMNMPLYQILMLDVIAVIAAGAALVAAVTYCCLHQIFRQCFQKENKCKIK